MLIMTTTLSADKINKLRDSLYYLAAVVAHSITKVGGEES